MKQKTITHKISIIHKVSIFSAYIARKCKNKSDLSNMVKWYNLTESEISEVKKLIDFKVYKRKEI